MANEKGGDILSEKMKTCAVLGGRGFIGRALVERLLRLGEWIVRVVDSSPSLEINSSESLLSDALASGQASYFHADVRQELQIVEAIKGVSVVFYTDCSETLPQNLLFRYQVVVQGTKNVIKACRECSVKILMYNSSADVVFDGVHDIRNGNESLPYSGQFWDDVSDLRAHAEALILMANDFTGLLTCVIRPSNVFGPGDQFLPMLVKVSKSFWAKFIIGSGRNESDFTYTENVAHAHICAVECLNSQVPSVAGKADYPPSNLGGPRVLYLMKFLVQNIREADTVSNFFRLAALASRTRTFSCSAAQECINYSPVVPLEEAVKSTIGSFSQLAINSPLMRNIDSIRQSKLERLLGSGKVADILLWRDEKKTFISFLSLFILYIWFFLTGQTFISSTAKLLLVTLILLSGHHFLAPTGCGSMLSRPSSSWFEVSEVDTRNSFLTMNCLWNKVEFLVNSLAQGEDWSTFFKVSTFLYICKLTIPKYFTAVIGLALILSFTLCFIYEQYEDKIDGFAGVAFSVGSNAIMLFMRRLPLLHSTQ